MSFEFLRTNLAEKESLGLLRERRSIASNKDGIIEVKGKHYINFASNDYLGLSQHTQVRQAFAQGIAATGTGSGASPLVTGYSEQHKALEDDICSVLNKPAALLFSSGFSANQAICHALFNQANNSAGHILCDKYMHASFIQGALETPAKLLRYQHNNFEHAQKQLRNLPANSLVATEGIFSMDGDEGEIATLAGLINSESETQDRPWLMVDDAHAFGVIGKSGFGSLDANIASESVDVVMGTFGKAVGTGGAFVAGSQALIDCMVNSSKHYIYSTAFSGAQAYATRTSLAIIEAGKERELLHNNIATFKQLAAERGLDLLPSNSPIQALIVACPNKAMAYSKKLAELGLWIPAIRTPTVPKNTDRLRITLSALHQTQDVHALIDGLSVVIHN
jgi:8-amino-7-oxononanoate synthase